MEIKAKILIHKDTDGVKWMFQLRLPIIGYFRNYWGHEYKSPESALKAARRCAKRFGWEIVDEEINARRQKAR